jgi:hypothetical protein
LLLIIEFMRAVKAADRTCVVSENIIPKLRSDSDTACGRIFTEKEEMG